MTDWIKYLTLRLTLWINGYEGGVLVAVQSPEKGWLDVEMVVSGIERPTAIHALSKARATLRRGSCK